MTVQLTCSLIEPEPGEAPPTWAVELIIAGISSRPGAERISTFLRDLLMAQQDTIAHLIAEGKTPCDAN